MLCKIKQSSTDDNNLDPVYLHKNPNDFIKRSLQAATE